MSTKSPKKKALSEREEIFYGEIGRRISVFRKACNMNQQQLAEKVGVNRITIAKLETGRQRVTFLLIEDIAQVLDVEISDVTGNVREMLKGKKAESIDPKLLGKLMEESKG